MAKERMRRGWTLASSSRRRAVRKASGLSARQDKKVTKANRAYKRGTRAF